MRFFKLDKIQTENLSLRWKKDGIYMWSIYLCIIVKHGFGIILDHLCISTNSVRDKEQWWATIQPTDRLGGILSDNSNVNGLGGKI